MDVRLIIDNEAVEAASGRWFERRNPVSHDVVTHAAAAGMDDAQRDTPEGEEVIYAPLPIFPERLRKLADAAESIMARYEAECRTEDERAARLEEATA